MSRAAFALGSGTDPAAGLDTYVVGGAVRDALLGLPAGDRDWVVVGATPEIMVARGFMPVGGDFPVFLHPVTKEEYALARTERKSGRGYKGFTFYTGPDVTLADDLRRRDLTVNAIARMHDGTLIDPWGGLRDMGDRVFRHIGEAFAEDPVRVLRLARFAARFVDFQIAPETLTLCREMARNGEVDALVPERVWREVSRGLTSAAPMRLFDVLADAQALPRIMPGLIWTDAVRELLTRAAQTDLSLAGRYALLCLQTEDRDTLSARLKVPAACADHARLLPQVCAHAQPSSPHADRTRRWTAQARPFSVPTGQRCAVRTDRHRHLAAMSGRRAQGRCGGGGQDPYHLAQGNQGSRPAGTTGGTGLSTCEAPRPEP